MRIHHKIEQVRRDFTAVYECENCGYLLTEHGYDDTDFHQNVIPEFICLECGEKSPDDSPRTSPDVPDWVAI